MPFQEFALAFDTAAEVYEQGRPGYPDEAVRWVVPAEAQTVLDLAAGTGKLTRILLHQGHDVVAVEPLEGMRAELARRAAEATIVAGTAERIPLVDGAVDAVVVAQAWQWFDHDAAVREIARVTRPGGTVGELFNCMDDREPWVAALRELIEASITARPVTNWYTHHLANPSVRLLGAAYGEVEKAEFAHRQRLSVTGLLKLLESFSYVILLPDTERRRFLNRATELARNHPNLAGLERIDLPYRTLAWRARRV